MAKKGSLFLVLFSFLMALALPGISYSQSANDGFNPNANGTVWSTAIQADGKILIAGEFTTIGTSPGTTTNHIARLNPDGSLDTDFVANADSTVYSIAVQADRKILVGGSFTSIGGVTRNCIARLNPDGTPDDEFIAPNVSGPVYAIAVQADGQVLIGGLFTKIGVEDRNYIARLNPDGSLDTDFVADADSTVNSIVVQTDGKILVGGYFTAIGGVTRNCIARLNPDGTLDTNFNPDTDFPPDTNNYVYSIAVQTDGKILLGGEFTIIGVGPSYISRLNPDGSLDTDFDPDTNNYVSSVAVQPDGKILIGGAFTTIGTSPMTTRYHIARLNSDGSLDTGFNPGANDGVNSIAVQADAKILIGGKFTTIGTSSVTTRYHIARLYLDGSLDEDLDPNGNMGWGTGWGIDCIGLQADGKILVGGEFTTISGTARNNIARLDPDGSLDLDFNPNANGHVRTIAIQPDGKILIGGIFTTIGTPAITRNLIARLNSDGSLDDGFNAGAFGGRSGEWIFSISVQPDGKILVGGIFTTIGAEPRNNIARLNPDGSLDEGFNPNANNLVRSFALQADGKIIVVGEFTTIGKTTMNHIARLNSNGTLDSSFNDSHVGGASIYSVVIQADEKILVGGWFSSIGGVGRNSIARLNKGGTLDTSFNSNANYPVASIAVQTDGKILIVGEFTSIGTPATPRNRIARLNPDGSVDTTFNPDANTWVLTTAIQADGKILAGGAFTTIGGVTRKGIARLTNTDAAIQELVVSSDGSSVTWMRGQASPEVWRVTFEHSADGVTWSPLGKSPLGDGTRISGGWQLTGLSLPISQNHYIRARGYATGGSQNVSGMVFESVRSLTVIPSTLEPVVSSFKINAGAASTAKGAVTLNNVATNKPSHYMATELPNFDWASWQSYSTAPIFNLSTGSGKKTVYFKAKNSSGESAWVSDSIEAFGPAVTSFKINAGALSTQNQLVTLNNTATNLPTHYMTSEDSSFAGAIWQGYSTAPSLALSTGGGEKTVYFKVKNAFEESAVIEDKIEALAPSVTSFKINAGAARTTNGVVTLNNTTTNLPICYMASERKDFSDTWWQLYSTAPKFALSAGSGEKTVYFKVKNAFEESAVIEGKIEGLAPAVISFKINAGAASTASSMVTLNNVATNIPTHYMASESPTFDGASWQTYSTAPKFTLSDGSGTKMVYFKVKNSFAESPEPAKYATIKANGVPPVVTSFKINAGATTTTKGKVTLNNVATNGPMYYKASEKSDFSDMLDWQPYSTAPSFNLSSNLTTENEKKTVYFKVKNSFGESPEPAKYATITALVPAVTSFKINAGAENTANSVVTLNNVATNGPTHYMASENSGFSGASWLPYSAAPKFILSDGGTGLRTVYFKVKNSIGESSKAQDGITAAGSAPVVTLFKINAGAASTGKGKVTLNNVATNSPTHYMASEKSDFSDAGWQTYSTAPSFSLSSNLGTGNETKWVYFKVKNIFGESPEKSDDILALGPSVTSFKINGGAASTANGLVTLNNVATNSPTHYKAGEDQNFVGADWLPYSTVPKFTLSDGSGEKKLYFKVKNSFAESGAISDTILASGLPPVVTSFKINAGASRTLNVLVTLNNTATNFPMYYMASEDPNFAGLFPANWQPYSTAPTFQLLGSGSGARTVYFKTMNIFGESSVVSDTISSPNDVIWD